LPRQILALVFIFVCTAITWAILSAIIFPRTFGSSEQLQGHVASTWGTFAAAVPRRRQPNFVNDVENSTTVENGKVVVHSRTVHRQTFLPVKASRIRVNFQLTPRQKGLLWYSTYRWISLETIPSATTPRKRRR